MISRPVILDKLIVWSAYALAGFLFVKNWGYTRTALQDYGPDAFVLASGINIIEAIFITVIVSVWHSEDDWGDKFNAIPGFFAGFNFSKKEIIKISLYAVLGLFVGSFVIGVYTVDIISTAQGRGASFGDAGALGWIAALFDGEYIPVSTVLAFVIGPEVICFFTPYVQRLLQRRELKQAAEKDLLDAQNKQLKMGRQLRNTQMGLEFKQQMDTLKQHYSGHGQAAQQSHGQQNGRRVINK